MNSKMNRGLEEAMNCCSNEATKTCCTNKAAETLVTLNKARSLAGDATLTVMAAYKDEAIKKEGICPKRRKRTVSVDFSAPCDCCPARSQWSPNKKTKKQRTFVEDLAALAGFLKKERQVLKTSSKEAKMTEFYTPSENDTELVAEWRKSGNDVHARMREKLRRLEDMEAKFGAWETHFAKEES